MVLRRAVPLFLCTLLAILLTGCGSTALNTGSNPINNSHASGSVHGGQQPIAGATIQIYTVGTTADGSAATPLLTSTVTSGADGTFTITGLYSCTGATQVYIVATGGNPGLSTVNPNIALMAALGPCSSLTPSTFISINELTTVAAVAALYPFMTSASAIGSASFDTAALANAFTLANQYVNTATGLSPGNVPSGYTAPTVELNTLADILSACINSSGGTAGDGSLCGRLFSLTTVDPNSAPTNTIQAMLNLAYNPTLNTSALYALTPPTPPFQPILTSAPANFLVSLQSASSMQVTEPAINFLNVAVGSFSPNHTITIQNFTGVSSVRVVGANSPDFSVGILSPPPQALAATKAITPARAGPRLRFDPRLQVFATPLLRSTTTTARHPSSSRSRLPASPAPPALRSRVRSSTSRRPSPVQAPHALPSPSATPAPEPSASLRLRSMGLSTTTSPRRTTAAASWRMRTAPSTSPLLPRRLALSRQPFKSQTPQRVPTLLR